VAGQITLRGDTDFSHTAQLDRWDEKDSNSSWVWTLIPKVVALAEACRRRSWRPLKRLPKYEILDRAAQPPGAREGTTVVAKGLSESEVVAEHVSDMTYQPHHCGGSTGW